MVQQPARFAKLQGNASRLEVVLVCSRAGFFENSFTEKTATEFWDEQWRFRHCLKRFDFCIELERKGKASVTQR